MIKNDNMMKYTADRAPELAPFHFFRKATTDPLPPIPYRLAIA